MATFSTFVACRREPRRSPPRLATTTDASHSDAAPEGTYRPPGCSYVVRPPHAGHLAVRPHSEVFGSHPDVRNLHLTFVGDPSNSIVVQWNTDAATLASRVRVWIAGEAPLPDAMGYSFPLPGAHDRRQHEVHICGLRPMTTYHYVAGGDRGGAPSHAFTTAPGGPSEVRVGVAGDARSNPHEWGLVARQLLDRHPDVLLFTGDAVADGGSVGSWNAFFAEGADLLAEVPGIWADGNHEGHVPLYYDQFAFPPANDVEFDEHFFAQTYGPLRVITLNDTTESNADIEGEETDFLRATLSSVDRARTPWVVTMHHQPLYTDAVGHRPDAITRSVWLPLFDRYHVDLDVAGHVHNYETTEPIAHGAVVPPGQGTRYIVFGGAGAPLYPFLPRQPWVHGRESTHGFGILTASATTLSWEAFRDDGTTIETMVLAQRPTAGAP